MFSWTQNQSMWLNPYFSGVPESQEKLDSRLVSKSNFIWRSCHGDALMERFRRLTFPKRLTFKENAKPICNRQKFHLWPYHCYKTCRNAQTSKVSITAFQEFYLKLHFWWQFWDSRKNNETSLMKSERCYPIISFFDALKNIHLLLFSA